MTRGSLYTCHVSDVFAILLQNSILSFQFDHTKTVCSLKALYEEFTGE